MSLQKPKVPVIAGLDLGSTSAKFLICFIALICFLACCSLLVVRSAIVHQIKFSTSKNGNKKLKYQVYHPLKLPLVTFILIFLLLKYYEYPYTIVYTNSIMR